MRVAFVAESFLPSINGVTNSVLRVLEHLDDTGHDAMVVSYRHPDGVPADYRGFPINTVPSLTLPWYRSLRMAFFVSGHIRRQLNDFQPDVVHLASPFLIGYSGVRAANRMGLPTVALYQTEVPNYIASYGYPLAEPAAWQHVRRIHNQSTLTLAPSSYTRDELVRHGVQRVDVWGRGVDIGRFNPARRDQSLHDAWAPNGEIVIGYMGRLGAEKQVENLRVLGDIPGARIVIIGDGPQRTELETALPSAIFVGMQTGDELSRHLASLDVFVHTGELETFGQAIQEAQASGLPVIAPRRGGPIDLVTPNLDGYLYAPGGLAELRSYVVRLVEDRELRESMAQASRQRTESRTWPVICDQLLEHYQAAIDAHRRFLG